MDDQPLLPTLPTKEDLENGVLLQKLNRRVVPYNVFFFLTFLARGNLGLVAAEICDDLNLSHAEFGFGASIFFVGMLFSLVPSGFAQQKIGAVPWLASVTFIWGLVATSMSFMKNTTQFYVLRGILGFVEGGCYQGMLYLFSTFYPTGWISGPIAYEVSTVLLSMMLSSPLAIGLLSLDGIFGVSGWRILFFTEGAASTVYGILLPYLLPFSVEKASFLTDAEKSFLHINLKITEPTPSSIPLTSQLAIVLSNSMFWCLSLSSLLREAVANSCFYSTALMIDDMLGKEDRDKDSCASSYSNIVAVVGWTSIPFSISCLLCFLVGWYSKKIKNRSKTAAWMSLLVTPFLVFFVVLRHVSFILSVFALSLAIAFNYAPYSFALGIIYTTSTMQTQALSVSLNLVLTTMGGFLGPIGLGILVDHYGYGTALSILPTVPFIGALLQYCVQDPAS